VKIMPSRAPLLLLENPENVFDLRPTPAALLVDVEGTLTEFSPSRGSVIEALKRFDEVARRNSVDLRRVHYITNADFKEFGVQYPDFAARVHPHARKPFFAPPEEFRRYGNDTVVVGDQYLTDGLLAWRFGFSFALVRTSVDQPTWPRVQRAIGRVLALVFFKVAEVSR